MKRKPPRRPEIEQWFEIPLKLVSQYGVLRLRGTVGADVSELLQSLLDGSYGRPFILDDGVVRRLHFDFRAVQSEMTIADPLELSFAYTRKMMAFLLFNPAPEHIVIVGLGGGSLTRFCARYLPRTRVTTIEIDEDIIAMSEFFNPPAWDRRVQLIHADAVDFFDTTDDYADVVLIDGCDRWGTAPVFCEASFYERVHARLKVNGMMVVNLIGRDYRRAAVLNGVDKAFQNLRFLMQVRESANRLLFAFHDLVDLPEWRVLNERAESLSETYGLNFPIFAQQLLRRHFSNASTDAVATGPEVR